MVTEPITTTGPTITVSSSQELMDAYQLLSDQDGGGTILMEGGEYGSFTLSSNTDGEQPVVIKSADPSDPAQFTSFWLRYANEIRFENVYVNSTDTGVEGGQDLYIKDSTGIQFVDSVFIYDGDNALKDAGAKADNGINIRDSDDILFEGNYLQGYFHALQVTNVTGTDIVGNEFTDIQGDGFRGGGLKDVTIADNYMHDFYGVNQHVTHSDLIQIWGTNAYIPTENLTITGNTLITSDASSQSIFIRNEEFGAEGDPTGGYFQNITITDNLIYNGHLHGIRVDDAQNVTVDGNTVLWNPDAWQTWGTDEPVNWKPTIVMKNVIDAEITNNVVAGTMTSTGDAELSGNQQLNYNDTYADNYVAYHFTGPLAGADVSLEDLIMLPSSEWYGITGSSLTDMPAASDDGVLGLVFTDRASDDRYEVTFDASYSVGEDGPVASLPGYSFHWTFADGSIDEGVQITKTFEAATSEDVQLTIKGPDGETVSNSEHAFDVFTKDIFAFDFEDGVANISDNNIGIVDKGALAASDDGDGFLIGDGNKLEITRSTEELFDLDSFGLALDLTPTGDENSGTFLMLYNTMEGRISDDGRIHFSLTTDEGSYSLNSQEPVFDDGETHRIGIAFDGTTGQLELFADGESVSSVEAWGTTPPAKYWNLVLGNAYKDSIDAILDNVEMSIDPSIAGALPEVSPPQEPPVIDVPDVPPVDESPEDPPVDESPEDPPENPPSEEPEDLIDTGDRGAPREPVESDGSSNFLSDLLDIFLSIFGLGGDDDTPPVTNAAAQIMEETSLEDIIPVTEALQENAIEEDDSGDDDDQLDIAA